MKKCKDRCREYEVRIAEYVKQAQHLNAANQDGTVYLKELQEFTKTAQASETEIGDLRHKAHNGVHSILSQQAWTDPNKKLAGIHLVAIMPLAKAARGKAKTLELQYEGIKKRYPKGLIGWSDMLDKEMAQARPHYKNALQINAELTAEIGKCIKIYQAQKVPGTEALKA